MKMGKKGRKAVSSFSHVFSFSWISKIKRMAGKPSPAPPSGPVPTKQNASTPPGTPANGSESTPCRLQRGRFSESGRPMCSITNFAYSPEVLDKRTGRSVAGFVEPEEDFWRFSFRRQSFEWERHGHRVGEEWPPAEDRGRRAFSVDFDSSPHIRQGGKIADTVCRIVADARTESQDGDRWCKMTQPSPRKPEADERKQQPQSQSFPPLNLKRPQHQKFKDLKPRGDKGEGREPRDVSRRRKWLAQRSPGRGDLFSPRTICKIRAVEEMKRRKRKNNDNFNGNRAGHQREGRRGLEGFAVVKRSWDPQRDFRESMVEMISEGKMGDGEELEKLLACYLELNPAEFHDLIVKVFRQVWFDLNRDCALAASELERGYFDY